MKHYILKHFLVKLGMFGANVVHMDSYNVVKARLTTLFQTKAFFLKGMVKGVVFFP